MKKTAILSLIAAATLAATGAHAAMMTAVAYDEANAFSVVDDTRQDRREDRRDDRWDRREDRREDRGSALPGHDARQDQREDHRDNRRDRREDRREDRPN
jgi:hypothetical protein